MFELDDGSWRFESCWWSDKGSRRQGEEGDRWWKYSNAVVSGLNDDIWISLESDA